MGDSKIYDDKPLESKSINFSVQLAMQANS